MLVKNKILWYKLSIRRIEFSALSDANGGEKRGDRRHVPAPNIDPSQDVPAAAKLPSADCTAWPA
jgi:hypothetical protein